MPNFQTEAVVSPGAPFSSNVEGGVHHPSAVLEFGNEGATTRVLDVDGSRLPVKSVETPVSSGGLDNHHVISAASSNAANIKPSAGQVYEIEIFNNADYPIYLKLHDTAGVPTAGVGVVYTVGVQAGTNKSRSFKGGLKFANGIARTIVRGIADNDTTAVALNDASLDISYK